MDKAARIFVAGHSGLAGAAILRKLQANGFKELLFRSRAELDLTRQQAVEEYFAAERPEYVFLAAAKVGGILANSTRPAEFIRDNLLIQTNVIDSAHRNGVKKLVFLGSSCIYPKFAPQPIREEYLLTGPLEPTNDAYALAKIAGIKMAQSYHTQYRFPAISLMPTNLYGPGDNFELSGSHVLPAMIRKFYEAKLAGATKVTIWGTGSPKREFLHVDDFADACIFLMDRYNSPEIVNVGTGEEISILDTALLVKEIIGFDGSIEHDLSKPDGTPRKLMDISRLTNLGWKASISLREGIQSTCEWFIRQTQAGTIRL